MNSVGPSVFRIVKFVDAVRSLWGSRAVEKRDSYLLQALSADPFAEGVCSFLEPEDLAQCMKTCRAWKILFDDDQRWENLCQDLLGIATARKAVLGEGSYRNLFQQVHRNILGERVYRCFIGYVPPTPPLPKTLSRWSDLDPCDPTTTIGNNYVWLYVPQYFEISSNRLALYQGIEIEGEKTGPTVKVPLTINNLTILFKKPRKGHPSTYRSVQDDILQQHGSTRLAGGWVCMRRQLLGQGLALDEQDAKVLECGVGVAQLAERILLNLVENVHFGAYLDGVGPRTLARTATMTAALPSGCGYGSSSGLCIDHALESGPVGVAVVL